MFGAIATHKVTHQPVLLRRGQMGTVLMVFERKAFLIDFADSQGNTFAMETIEPKKLLRLISEPKLVPKKYLTQFHHSFAST